MKSEDALLDRCQFVIKLGKKWCTLDMSGTLAEGFGLSKSEVRRLIQQGAMTIYRQEEIKVKYEKP